MPLTISHPIAALPIWYVSRRRLDLTALMFGAMIPDLQYFLALQPVGNIGHSAYGILVEGLPAGFALLVIFTCVMAEPLRALLPARLGRLVPTGYTIWPLPRLAIILVSIAIGAASHVFWDSFTHRGAFFAQTFDVLQAQLGPMALYEWLQYGSGVFGLAGLSLWAAFAGRGATSLPSDTLTSGSKAPAGAVIAAAMAIMVYLAMRQVTPLSGKVILVQGVIGVIVGIWVGVLLYAVSYHAGLFRREKRSG